MSQGVDAASFDFYEGIRIFVPGALAVGLAVGVNATFEVVEADLAKNQIVGILAALIAGLFFYFLDAPAKSAVMKPLQPTEYLLSLPIARKDRVLNAYFVMLDTDIPAAIRARALYMGSMFRIGFEAIYLLLFTSLGVLLVATQLEPVRGARPQHSSPIDRYVIVAVLFLVCLSALRRELINRSPRRPHEQPLFKALRKKVERPRAARLSYDVKFVQYSHMDAAIAAVSVGGFVVLDHLDQVATPLHLAPPALAAVTFGVRYFRGYQRDWRSRVPMDSVHAAFMATVALGLTLASLYRVPAHLTVAEERCWSVVAIVSLILIVARGHERRLRGAYATQNTWLEHNQEMMIAKYFSDPKTAAAGPAPAPPSSVLSRVCNALRGSSG